MRRAIVVASTGLEHQGLWGNAFAQGLRRHGWRVTVQPTHGACDLLCVWGVRRSDAIKAQRQDGGELVVLERGYVGDRNSWTSLSFGGGLNGRGEFRVPADNPARWRRHFEYLMQPWQDRAAGDVLIMGQVDGDMAVANTDIHAFYRAAAAAYADAGYHTRLRPHPQARGAHGPLRTLREDLAHARAVVTWSSNSAVDAVIAGVPTVAMDAGSMAWAVSGHVLGVLPPMPDRTAWAHRLAWCQWQIDEIASGLAWDVVGREAKAA